MARSFRERFSGAALITGASAGCQCRLRGRADRRPTVQTVQAVWTLSVLGGRAIPQGVGGLPRKLCAFRIDAAACGPARNLLTGAQESGGTIMWSCARFSTLALFVTVASSLAV